MRLQSYQEMLIQYGDTGLDSDDAEKRNEMLSKYEYSVIIEGEFKEFDNLDKWIKINFGEDAVQHIWYGKIDYNYGFAEYFLNEEKNLTKLTQTIPNIYTKYPDANPSEIICKSDGSSKSTIYNPRDINAIVLEE